MNRQRGMTMIELMVSLAIVMVIIGAATTAYLKLLRTYKTQGKLAESYMANLTGLELLRYDIEMAGFGLPVGLAAGAAYSEANDSSVQYYNPATLNDLPNNAPRALAHLNDLGANGSDVLAIKSSAANPLNNPAGKKWSLITNPTGSMPMVKMWGDAAMNFITGDRFIVLDNTYQLKLDNSSNWCFTFSGAYYTNAVTLTTSLNTPSQQSNYYIYGLDNNSTGHRMPFNRVDYYLDKITADFPSSCDGNTYTLYRSTISQQTGALSHAPLIDCVRDFQVAFGIPDANGNMNWVRTLGTMTASDILAQVREVRVFLLYQEGLGDTGKSPDFRFAGTLNLGDQEIAGSLDSAGYSGNPPPNTFQQLSNGPLPGNNPQLSSWAPTGSDLQYRWKIIEMAIKPMNLITQAYTTR